MDLDRLYDYFTNKKYTDITLVLIDSINRIQLDVHKLVLCAGTMYFEKILENFAESNSQELTLNVPSANVAYDVIMSFYGQTSNKGELESWHHQLEMIKCRNFFGIDQEALLDMDVPEDAFELLLDAIDIIGYDETTINIINRNIPLDYDTKNFPEELKIEMARLSSENHIVFYDKYNNVNFYNLATEEIEYYNTGCKIKCMAQSIDTKILAIVTETGITIYDIFLLEIFTLRFDTSDILCLCISSDNKLLYTGCKNDIIMIYDFEGKLIDKIFQKHHPNNNYFIYYNGDYSENIKKIYYSPTSTYFATYNKDGFIQILNTITNTLIHQFHMSYDTFCFSNNGTYITFLQQDQIDICNPLNGQRFKSIQGITAKHGIFRNTVMCYSHDDKYLVIAIRNLVTYVIVVNIESSNIYKKYEIGTKVEYLSFTADDKNIIAIDKNNREITIIDIANKSLKPYNFSDEINNIFPINMSVSKYLFRKSQ